MQKPDKKPDSLIYTELCDALPDFCRPFFTQTGNIHTLPTRLGYIRDLHRFFSYLIYNHPQFAFYKEASEIKPSDLDALTTSDIDIYITKELDRTSPKTVARKKAALSSFYHYMTSGDRNVLKKNPMLAVTKVIQDKDGTLIYLDMEEQIKLINTVMYGTGLDKKKALYHARYQKRDTALILLALDTGLRVSEIHRLDIIDVDLNKCMVQVYRKRRKIQEMSFSDEVRDAICDYLSERTAKVPDLALTEPLFVTLKGERLTVRAIEYLVKKYAASSVGMKAAKVTPHKLRSSFAMEYYRATDKDILALQEALGHDSLVATNIYAKATKDEMVKNRGLLAQRRKEEMERMQKEEAEKINNSLNQAMNS